MTINTSSAKLTAVVTPEPPLDPAPFVCPRCGSVNGWIPIAVPAWGITQVIPGCRYCRLQREPNVGK
jgi:hypothetical protein